jgi:type IV secretion system protein TrbL
MVTTIRATCCRVPSLPKLRFRAAWRALVFVAIIANAATMPAYVLAQLQQSAVSSDSVSKGMDSGLLDRAVEQYKKAAAKWEAAIRRATMSLFAALSLIQLIWVISLRMLQGGGLTDLLVDLVKFTITTGLHLFLLKKGVQIAQWIVYGLVKLVADVTGQSKGATPSELVNTGFQLVGAAFKTAASGNTTAVIVSLVLSLIIFGFLIVCAFQVAKYYVGATVLIFAGQIFLGFGGCQWTSELAIGYFRQALAIGVRIFVVLLILFAGQDVINENFAAIANAPAYEILLPFLVLPKLITLLVAAMFLTMFVFTIPDMLGSVVGQAMGGGPGLGTVTGALGTAATLAAAAIPGVGGAVAAAKAASAAAGAAASAGSAGSSPIAGAIMAGMPASGGGGAGGGAPTPGGPSSARSQSGPASSMTSPRAASPAPPSRAANSSSSGVAGAAAGESTSSPAGVPANSETGAAASSAAAGTGSTDTQQSQGSSRASGGQGTSAKPQQSAGGQGSRRAAQAPPSALKIAAGAAWKNAIAPTLGGRIAERIRQEYNLDDPATQQPSTSSAPGTAQDEPIRDKAGG